MNSPTIDKGFYYHYKHDPSKGINDHAYEVLGLGKDTETEGLTVIYRPLYKSAFLEPADFYIRPYKMFIENLEINGKRVARFEKIIAPDLIEKLKKF